MHPSRPPLSQDHIKLSNLPGFRSKPYYFHQQSDFLSLQIPVVKVGQPHEGSQACIKTLCSMGGRVDGFLKKQCCVRPLCKEGSHGVLLQESLHISYRGPTLLLVLTWKLGQKLKKRTVRCFAWARARACAPSGTKASRRQAPIVNLLLQQPMLLDTGGAEERLHSQAGHVQLWPTPRSCICYWDGIYMDIPIYPEIYTYIPKVYTTINSTPSAQIGRSPFNLRHLSRTVAPFIPSLVSTT